MDFSELKKFISEQDKRLNKYFQEKDNTKKILARTVKLNEEVGELCEAVLSHLNDQRDEKLAKRKLENIGEEVADVLITTLLLAEILNIDFEKEIEIKKEKVIKRFSK